VGQGGDLLANRVADAALFAVMSYFATWFIRSQSVGASYPRLFREHAGGEGPFVFELEITSEALIATSSARHIVANGPPLQKLPRPRAE
jgi:hypothetical protein